MHVEGVHHTFRSTPNHAIEALNDINITLQSGEFLSIIGPSGCGKSTLLRIVAGLESPSAGTVSVEGERVRAGAGPCAYMPQQDLLLPWRRAIDNAILAAEIHGTPRPVARATAETLFARFGLDGFERAWPRELSGGMRQRLSLLRTFLADRSVMLLDEPFGALDAITRRSMWEWLSDVLAEQSRSVVFVTHDVDEAIVLSDRIMVMSRRPGRIVADIEIVPPQKRSASSVVEPWFNDYRSAVLDALRRAHAA